MLFMEKDENGFQNFSIRILESTESLRQVVLDEFENFIFNSSIMSGVNKIDEPTRLCFRLSVRVTSRNIYANSLLKCCRCLNRAV